MKLYDYRYVTFTAMTTREVRATGGSRRDPFRIRISLSSATTWLELKTRLFLHSLPGQCVNSSLYTKRNKQLSYR